MLTLFFLVAVSVFIPAFWFITLGYLIYLVATRKQRRDKVILHEIMQSIAQESEPVILDYLYFDSAKSFAFDHGATDVLSKDKLLFSLDFNGVNYQIMLQRWDNDGTLLSVCRAENVQEVQKRGDEVEHFFSKNTA
ncbi:MAG: hypothetical protein OQK77_01670 [Psychromonas sp.]|nr:hypothetical protein [Psychromonas sp.]